MVRRAVAKGAGLAVAVLFGVLAGAPLSLAQGDVLAEGRHIVIRGPPAQVDAVRSQLPILDDTYDALAQLVAAVPYDGMPVEIVVDPLVAGAIAGNPIRVHPDEFDDTFWFMMAHELAHDFTLAVGWQGLGCPSSGWIEGWAQFARQDVLRSVVPRYPGLADGNAWFSYEGFREFLLVALGDYEANGTYAAMDPNAFAGMLQALTDDHGWNATAAFMRSMDEPILVQEGLQEGECTRFLRLAEASYGVPLRGRLLLWRFPIEEEEEFRRSFLENQTVPVEAHALARVPDPEVPPQGGPRESAPAPMVAPLAIILGLWALRSRASGSASGASSSTSARADETDCKDGTDSTVNPFHPSRHPFHRWS